MKACKYCAGEGFILDKDNKYEECPYCNGTGVQNPPEPKKKSNSKRENKDGK